MAGGVMSQVQGIIPGMRREEEVPDPAPPQEEYQEYQVGNLAPGFLMLEWRRTARNGKEWQADKKPLQFAEDS